MITTHPIVDKDSTLVASSQIQLDAVVFTMRSRHGWYTPTDEAAPRRLIDKYMLELSITTVQGDTPVGRSIPVDFSGHPMREPSFPSFNIPGIKDHWRAHILACRARFADLAQQILEAL